MQNYLGEYKNKLVTDFWLPKVNELSRILCPRSKKNKSLKMLSLTSHENFLEVPSFIEANLTLRDRVFLLTYNFLQTMRLEADGFEVIATARYEDTIPCDSHELVAKFPFEILNLDFLSQDATEHDGRLEREIESIETTFKLQNQKQPRSPRGFIVIYTTLVDDARSVDIQRLIGKLNTYPAEGWSGLNASSFPGFVTTVNDKLESLERLIKEMATKYAYRTIGFDRSHADGFCSIVLGVN